MKSHLDKVSSFEQTRTHRLEAPYRIEVPPETGLNSHPAYFWQWLMSLMFHWTTPLAVD